MKKVLLSLLILFSLPLISSANSSNASKTALQFTINGSINPAIQDYVAQGIKQAKQQDAKLIIIRMDTPGGLDSSMRGIVKLILASPVPVVSYVWPRGARAASAGTFILYGSPIAAMSPGTNLGSASPVQIGGGQQSPNQPNENKQKEKNQKTTKTPEPSTLEKKVQNDAIAYIKSLAELHQRNADWAVKAVSDAANITAREALKNNVINTIASNSNELLQKIDGMPANLDGKTITLKTKDLKIINFDQNWRTKLLSVIANPSIAYILLLAGIYGLLFEFMSPGMIFPGTVGAISLCLGLFALQLLPIDMAGVALIILGLVLLLVEIFSPSFGILGIGGIIGFAFGSVLFFESPGLNYQVPWVIIIVFSIINVLFFLVILNLILRSRKRKVVSGTEELMSATAIVIDDFTDKGQVHLHGEIWQAVTNTPLKKGEKVTVVKLDGLIVTVEKERKQWKQ